MMAFPYTFDIYYALSFLSMVCVFATIHYKIKFRLWRKKGVNGPLPLPFIGTIYTFFCKDGPSTQLEFTKKYGRVYGMYDGSTPKLMTTDSKLVKQVTVKDFHIFTNRIITPNTEDILDNVILRANDGKWKRLRKVISPTFTSGKIKRMKPLIDQCIRNATEFLETTSENNQPLNLKQFWSRFTLEVIACCCFARDINSHKDPNNIFYKHVTNFFKPPRNWRLIRILLFTILPQSVSKFLGISILPVESTNYLSAVIRPLLVQRRQEEKKFNDFLQLLIEAEKEREDKNEPPLSEVEIIANCIVFFVAGHETTATLLTWSSFVLATHPEIQEKLFKEINENIENADTVEYDTVKNLQYLDAFVCETLRMYPPLIQTDRMNSAEVELESTGIKIPPKTIVSTLVYAMHHDPYYYPEPEKFYPERFIGENRDAIDPYAYLPFGSGPRNCIAMRFALFEAKLALINTVKKFKFSKSPRTPMKPIISKATNFMISEDIFVNIEKR